MKKYKLYLKKSTIPGAGKGLFTGAFIKRGAFITEYYGERIDWETGTKRMQSGKGGYILNLPDKILDAMNALDCFGRYVNDAEGLRKVKGVKNNSVIFFRNNGKCFFRAIRNIQENEEILAAYGDEYWEVQKEVKAKLRKKKLAREKLLKEKQANRKIVKKKK